MRPEELSLSDDRARLIVSWPSGEIDEIPAPVLRENARDAGSVRKRLDFGAVSAAPDLTIEAMQLIGAFAVNVTFSDGHDRAIYPWPYLREIAAGNAIN